MQSFIPKPGYVWNPLVRLSVNVQCPCGSGLKFKRCCEENVPRYVPKENLHQWIELLEIAERREPAW